MHYVEQNFFCLPPFYNSNQKGEKERETGKLGHVMDREPDMVYNFFTGKQSNNSCITCPKNQRNFDFRANLAHSEII